MKLIGKIKRAWKAHRWYIVVIAVLVSINTATAFMYVAHARRVMSAIELIDATSGLVEAKYLPGIIVSDSLAGVIDARIVGGLHAIREHIAPPIMLFPKK